MPLNMFSTLFFIQPLCLQQQQIQSARAYNLGLMSTLLTPVLQSYLFQEASIPDIEKLLHYTFALLLKIF